MRLAVISSAALVRSEDGYLAYSPYGRELDIWADAAGEVEMMCPVIPFDEGLLLSPLNFKVSRVFRAKAFSVTSVRAILHAFAVSFRNFYLLFRIMQRADHIHLRCPGNIGLMGCIVQVFFPKKRKTAKYAGNWDPDSRQPFTYKLQQWLLNNTFLTRNMTVLVYGQWDGASKNIKPFFTATYNESDKVPTALRSVKSEPVRFVFAGSLSGGKRPLYAIKLVENLLRSGIPAELYLFGNGKLRDELEEHISQHALSGSVKIMGNATREELAGWLRKSHFLILASRSEGWPKVVAEAMFWGCVPLSTRISCVPYMLGEGRKCA